MVNCVRLGVTLEVLKQITRLSGITNEIKMPHYHLTAEEEKLLLPEVRGGKDHKKTGMLYSSSDSQMCTSKKVVSAKTVETLSNEMVSNIMGEIKKMSTEKIVQNDPSLSGSEEDQQKQEETKRQLVVKLLNVELECLQLAFLKCAALKTLNLLLTTNEYSQHFLFPSVFDKDSTHENGTTNIDKTDVTKWIMSNVVNKAVQQYKHRNVTSIAEIERAESILHLNYIRCKSEEDVNKVFETEVNSSSADLTTITTPQSSLNDELRSFVERGMACLPPPSSSRFGMSLNFSDNAPMTGKSLLTIRSNDQSTSHLNSRSVLLPFPQIPPPSHVRGGRNRRPPPRGQKFPISCSSPDCGATPGDGLPAQTHRERHQRHEELG